MPSPEDPAVRPAAWSESVRFAVSSLALDKTKTSLTMLSVVIGSTAIVLVVTIAASGGTYIVAQIEGIGANLTYATLDRSGNASLPDDELVPEDLVLVRQALPAARAVAGTYDIPVDFQVHNNLLHARLVGVTQDFEKIRNLEITSGRYFDREDFAAHFKVCLFSDTLARKSFGTNGAVGETVRVDQFGCTIIGTFKEGVPTFGQSEIQDETVLIPFALVQDITGDKFFQVLYVQAASHGEVAHLTRQLDQLLHVRHRKQVHYFVENLSSLIETANKIALAMTVLLIAIAALALTIAGTGIMNIMLFNVSERTHEIGLRKALGARPSQIRLQFLLEALLISSLGATIGVGAALGLIWSFTLTVPNAVSLSVSWWAVLVAFALSSGTGLVFGYRPASEAARLDPIQALRTE
jgi:putative ABC transport system permease protein